MSSGKGKRASPLILLFIVSAATASVLVPVTLRAAKRFGLLDSPGPRKDQVTPVPLLGGLSLAMGATMGLWVLGSDSGILLFGAWGALGVGLIDDWRRAGLSPTAKLIALCAVTSLALGLEGQDGLGGFTLRLVWMVAVATAFNFSDNMNGLCAGLGLIPGLILLLRGDSDHALGVAISGAALGFLFFNYPRAKIYLGDAGSHFLGFIWGWYTWPLSGGLSPGLIAIPLVDMAFVVVLRCTLGLAPWRGDHRHLSHQAVRLGLSKKVAVLLLWTLAFAAGWIADQR